MIAIDLPKEQLRDFCRKWKITEFALFGSVTRPEAFGPESDIDVMVRFADGVPWTLFDMVDMREQLMSIFGRDVDLLTKRSVERSLNDIRRDAILGSAVTLELN